jgi:hypothetical protein
MIRDLKKIADNYCDRCIYDIYSIDACRFSAETGHTNCFNAYFQLRQTIALEEIASSLKKLANPMPVVNPTNNMPNEHHHAIFGGSDEKD